MMIDNGCPSPLSPSFFYLFILLEVCRPVVSGIAHGNLQYPVAKPRTASPENLDQSTHKPALPLATRSSATLQLERQS